jgi:hypothetical protein
MCRFASWEFNKDEKEIFKQELLNYVKRASIHVNDWEKAMKYHQAATIIDHESPISKELERNYKTLAHKDKK